MNFLLLLEQIGLQKKYVLLLFPTLARYDKGPLYMNEIEGFIITKSWLHVFI